MNHRITASTVSGRVQKKKRKEKKEEEEEDKEGVGFSSGFWDSDGRDEDVLG